METKIVKIYTGSRYEAHELAAEELTQMEVDALNAQIEESSRPLTDGEILRLDMRRRVNSLSIDNATAGRMVDYFPTRAEYCGEGELIPAKTRIRDDKDGSVIWRANVDLWNTPENSPENAPTLWERIAYRDGIRIAPEKFTSTNAAGMNEYMWFGNDLYQSLMAGNAYMPEATPNVWKLIRSAYEGETL